ncbi:DUF429 domain-containing protein [Nocardioides sp.]|uniref:DUF429 domain-containing protein n=1 Tax=Nocardioides sp. TaxID=35761 RepID=UPI003513D85C
MHYVGIDLAWGERNPTGVAVLDAAGRLLHVSAQRSDDDIEAALAAYVDGDCVVAIDAPLVVTNPTGSRPAEQALSADFRRFDAGTHPTNLGKPEFAEGPRGGRLAKRLGLDVNPRSRRRRRAMEVYPHAASIVLFDLPKVLKYKNKPGRDLDLLRSEMLRLMRGVEQLHNPDGPDGAWARLRHDVEHATRKSQLRHVEDQVDAVLCACIARFADTRPDDVTLYGDLETGYIVTPSLGAAVVSRHKVVREAVARYAAEQPAREVAAAEAVARITHVLDEAGINYLSVTGRAKSVTSFAEKAGRTRDGEPLYPDPLHDIGDQIGVRVITYVRGDVDRVAALLASDLVVTDDRDLGRETAGEGRFGYASRHLQVRVDDTTAQVQVRTVLQHAWAEFEHDIRYKGAVPPEHVREFDRRFTLAAGLLELADREFAEIRERVQAAAPPAAAAADASGAADWLDPRALGAFLATHYPEAQWSRAEHYGWLSGLLQDLDVTTFAALAEVLGGVDEDLIGERMAYRQPPGAVRRLDDALLQRFGRRYVELPGNAHRTTSLSQRLARLTDPDATPDPA